MRYNVPLQILYSFDGNFYLSLMVLTSINAQDSLGKGGGVGGRGVLEGEAWGG